MRLAREYDREWPRWVSPEKLLAFPMRSDRLGFGLLRPYALMVGESRLLRARNGRHSAGVGERCSGKARQHGG